ncbi:MAG: C-type lectin domain-containing protein [Myxococcales bacterium]|nr:C-type lectin domain-containing protein [Myxococcales bacterium]
MSAKVLKVISAALILTAAACSAAEGAEAGSGDATGDTGASGDASCTGLECDPCAGGGSCDDSNPCTQDSCEPASGCLHTAVTAACDDGDACTIGDACAAGACAGSPRTCDDGIACTGDTCDSALGCTTTPLATGTACDDGNACTTSDLCEDGACAGTKATCDDGNSCTTDTCDLTEGCVSSPVVNGTPCDDGDACTAADVCTDRACAGAAVPCDDGNSCTIDICDTATGCTATALGDGSACDDGSACTKSEVCALGICTGAAVDCNDHYGCTADSCDPTTGCVHDGLQNGDPCDDEDACTTDDRCWVGFCGGKSPDCQDGKWCTIDGCDPITAECTHQLSDDPLPCDDGDACTANDACAGEACVGPVAADCDDHTVCTTDLCDPALGCVHAPVNEGALCDDGNTCSLGDTCAGGVCGGFPVGASAFEGHCYVYVEAPAVMADAEADCVTLGGHITSLHSEGQDAFVRSLIRKVPDCEFTSSCLTAWIGASTTGVDFCAVDGAPYWMDNTTWDYVNWPFGSNQPLCFGQCIAIMPDQFGFDLGWRTADCGVARGYVCQYPP